METILADVAVSMSEFKKNPAAVLRGANNRPVAVLNHNRAAFYMVEPPLFEALMEELAVDKRFGLFVNHDLASYEVPVHADIPHQDVIFLDEADDKVSPMKAKGVGELGLCGVGAAIANAVYNATGVRVRDYPITLDKHLDKLPAIA